MGDARLPEPEYKGHLCSIRSPMIEHKAEPLGDNTLPGDAELFPRAEEGEASVSMVAFDEGILPSYREIDAEGTESGLEKAPLPMANVFVLSEVPVSVLSYADGGDVGNDEMGDGLEEKFPKMTEKVTVALGEHDDTAAYFREGGHMSMVE